MIPLPITAEAKLIAGAVAALALAGAVWYAVHDLEARGAQSEQLAVAQQHAADVDQARAREAQIHTAQEASDREADKFNLQAALAVPRARGAAVGLQQRFAAINAGCVPEHPAASAGGPAASSAADLRADVQRRLGEAAGQLAAFADKSRGSGLKSEGRYDALTPGARSGAKPWPPGTDSVGQEPP